MPTPNKNKTYVHLCYILEGKLHEEWTSKVIASFSSVEQARNYLRSDTFIQDYQKPDAPITPLFFLLSEGQIFYLEPFRIEKAVEIATLPIYDADVQA